MADDADLATTNTERELELRIKSLVPVETPKGTGECWNCYTPLADGRRWCDSSCRDDWTKLSAKEREQESMNRAIFEDD